MRKGTKIALITLGVLFALGIAVFVGADVLMSRFVKKEVDKALAALPEGQASCGDIYIRFFSGTAEVRDLAFAYPPALDIHVDRIEVGRVLYSALIAKQIWISDVNLVRPSATILYDSKNPDSLFPQMQDSSLAQAGKWLLNADIERLKIKNAALSFKDIRTGLEVAADSVSVRLYDLEYSFADSLFSYNDSVYRLEVGNFRCYVPDEPMNIEMEDVATRDAGELTTGMVHIGHALAKKALGNKKKEPVTWIDMRLDNVSTSPINIIRKALAQDLTLDKLTANVRIMDVYRDARYAPKKPFPMPQEVLKQIPVPFAIKRIDARIKKIDVGYASTNVNCGEMHLKDIQATVENMSNKRGGTILVHGGCPVNKGKAKAEMRMTLNKTCDWSTKLHVEGINTNYLNTFLRPLVGMTCDCQIDTLDADYKGDLTAAAGRFRMLYHGLKVQVHKEDDIPYKIVTNNADALTTMANTLIPKSNPTAVDIRPRAYAVEWKRDVWQPFPLYMFGPCIDGAKKTMLPGLYVHKQVK